MQLGGVALHCVQRDHPCDRRRLHTPAQTHNFQSTYGLISFCSLTELVQMTKVRVLIRLYRSSCWEP